MSRSCDLNVRLHQIHKHLKRLEVSGENDAYSGLVAEAYINEEDEKIEEFVVLYDDYGKGIYKISKLLKILEQLTISSLESDSSINIWQQISDALVGY